MNFIFKKIQLLLCLLCFQILLCQPPVLSAQADPDEFYLTQVKPILQGHCFECHAEDPEDFSGGLALTSSDSIRRGGDSGAAIDSNSPADSLFLQAINYDVYEMPPSGKLPQEQIDVLTQWVEMGVPMPADEEVEHDLEAHSSVPQVNAETKKWWSFQPVLRPEIPTINQPSWPQNEIDHFILANLESVSLTPAPPATKQQLIRRAYYDLIGLPPKPEEVEAFVNDNDPQAFANLIDQLLESPHYGEKWGRHWLDLVRYAETNSFERDSAKPFVWRYRDYVIKSFNEDKPYDQFLIEQLAGDELPDASQESWIATGYYRLGAWDDEPADRLQAKFDELDDIVATTSQTMLGLTVNCARCHDHKIDPIPQADYYRIVSFFENMQRYGVRDSGTVESNSIKLFPGNPTAEEREKYDHSLARLEKQIAEIEAIVKPDFQPVEHEDFAYEMNRLKIVEKRVGTILTKRQFDRYQRAREQHQEATSHPPGSISVLCVKEESAEAPASYIRVRGNASVTGDEVEPGFVSVLSPPDPEIELPTNRHSTGRRLALAKWIASSENPLTARVMANRLWQYHFGRGIVRSSSDFGFQGTPPTHPHLLDWLAAELVQQNWSVKAMHRIIMNSSAYQMSGQYNPSAEEIDPANDRFWRFDLRRLTAEEIRDSILAVNDQLNLTDMYGPSVYPIQPAEVLAGQSVPGQGWNDSSESDRRRRSVYIHIKRSLPVPILSTNDSADTDNTCPVRFITTQPTQSLGMMNSAFTNQQAEWFAQSVVQEQSGLPAQVETVLKRVTQRQPQADEINRGVDFINELKAEESVSEMQALETFCLLALNLNEFVYVD